MTTVDAVLAALAERLADPACTGAANASLHGAAGLALFYAELSTADPAHRGTVHQYLARANNALADDAAACLYDGVPAVAFVADAAAQRPGDYGTLLAALDDSVRHTATSVLDVERRRIDAGAVATTSRYYDAVFGLTGIGRYLLRRRESDARDDAVLRAVLDYLVALTRPILVDDAELPGWWVRTSASVDGTDDDGGTANFGLAHGVPGPLALLSLAWRDGVRVAGHREAITSVADHLLDWAGQDEAGYYWPTAVSRGPFLRHEPVELPLRAAWCYGIPGVARALQLAGLALGREDWSGVAVDAVHGMFRRSESTWGVPDSRLCHGWAGLLHVVACVDADAPGSGLREHVDALATRTVAAFDAGLRYGYRMRPNAWESGPQDDPGLLNGAAGIGLALHTYRTGAPSATGWDAVLLVN